MNETLGAVQIINDPARKVGAWGYDQITAPPPLPTPNDSLTEVVLDEIIALFRKKNAKYTRGVTEFAGFTEAIPVTKGRMNAYQYAFALLSKHLDAVEKLVQEPAHVRREWEEIEERCKDLSTYFAIMAAMARQEV